MKTTGVVPAGALRSRLGSATRLCLLTAVFALTALPATASATPDMRGEWDLTVTAEGHSPVHGTSTIRQEASGGTFSGSALFEGVVGGTFSVTPQSSTDASVRIIVYAFEGHPEGEIISSPPLKITETGGGHLTLSGEGEAIEPGKPNVHVTSLVATLTRTHNEIEEQEKREAKEREEEEKRRDLPGEWSLTIKAGSSTYKGTAIVSEPANAGNKFASSTFQLEGVTHGSFSGSFSESGASAKVSAQAEGSSPSVEFESTAIAIGWSSRPLSMSGEGILKVGGTTISSTAELTATRIKTYAEVVKQRALEKQEEEEKRRDLPGEWSLTIKAGSSTYKGTAIVSEAANAKNEFASSTFQLEGVTHGSFSGSFSQSSASAKVSAQAEGSTPAVEFESTAIAIAWKSSPLSMSGQGTLKVGGTTISSTAELTATLVRTYTEIVKQREAAEKAEKEAKEKTEREATERQQREAREKLEHETSQQGNKQTAPTLVSVVPANKTLSLARANVISLTLLNHNALAVHGRVQLLLVAAGRASAGAKHKRKRKQTSVLLGAGSFTISAGEKGAVRIKLKSLPKSAGKTLHIQLKLVTEASGNTSVTSVYSLTLRLAPKRRA